ncbi:MAG: trypsin-like peptidase domain-containing protein [Candidatus Taylorbacteria bacterium]|nr:trypsin-like peptidase domain-containing protein [Candidatus Taylorbacteria bacterium]
MDNYPNNRYQVHPATAIIAVFLTVLTLFALYNVLGLRKELAEAETKVAAAVKNADEIKKTADEQLSILRKQIVSLDGKVSAVSGESKQVALSLSEIEQRQAVKQKSQEELVTAAVATVAPSVVSIIATKDVPKVEVVYENPFGNDPFFKNMEIEIPVLRQKGVQTQKISSGSGFIVTADGYIVTNRHVVQDPGASYTAIMPNGTTKQIYVVYRDQNLDLAVLKVAGTIYTPARLGDSSGIKLGQTVIAIGNALGEYDNSVSIGIISGLNRAIEASGAGNTTERLTGVIQTDAAINPGNSGGPLVDLDGRVVGINVATVTGTNNISFSIPINALRATIQRAIGRQI